MKSESDEMKTGFPSIDKPWLKYYTDPIPDADDVNCTMYEYLNKYNKDYPEEIALEYFGNEITYGELLHNIDKAAELFLKLNVKKGDYVYFLAVTVPETIYSIYALNKIGAVPNMMDPRNNIERTQMFMEKVRGKVLVIMDSLAPKYKPLFSDKYTQSVLLLSPADSLKFPKKNLYRLKTSSVTKEFKTQPNCFFWNDLFNAKETALETSVNYDKSAKEESIIVYTGGTTGVPKGAVLSDVNWNFVTLMSKMAVVSNNKRQSSLLLIMPPFIAYGIMGLHTSLSLGKRVILIPKFDAEKFENYILKYKPNHVFGVPSYFEKLSNSKKIKNLSYLRTVIVGGDKLSAEFENKINEYFKSVNSPAQIKKGYGMTELSSAAVFTKDGCNKPDSVGIPYYFNNIKIIDSDTGKELPYNTSGELLVSAPTIMTGYLNNQEETDKLIVLDENKNKWVKTGDIAYIDEDGFLFIVDRKKRMIIRPDGHNVFPNILEKILNSNPLVELCAVVGEKDAQTNNGYWPVAFVVLKDIENSDKENLNKQLMDFMLQKVPGRDCIQKIYFINEMPLTPIGKVDYLQLEKKLIK